jgi:TetR/AcrR family transcriptional repressor of nem operon
LVQAAGLLFAERGYQSAAVADILERAGANSGSLYHFFESKRDLLVEVLDRHRRDLAQQLASPDLLDISDPVDRVFRLLGSYRDALAANGCRRGCPVGALIAEVRDPDQQVRAAMEAYFDLWLDSVERWFEEAAVQSPLGREPRDLATLTLAVAQGAIVEALARRSIEPFDRALALLRQALAGLGRAAEVGAEARDWAVSARDRKQKASLLDRDREIVAP